MEDSLGAQFLGERAVIDERRNPWSSLRHRRQWPAQGAKIVSKEDAEQNQDRKEEFDALNLKSAARRAWLNLGLTSAPNPA